MRVYLAGPMRGVEKYNFPTFHLVAAALRAQGWEVISPAEMDMSYGSPELAEANMTDAMRRDLGALLSCDGLVLLPGWEASRGAVVEKLVADCVGIKSFTYGGLGEPAPYAGPLSPVAEALLAGGEL